MNSIIQTPTNGLTNSLAFYKKIGFTVLSAANPTIVSDGKAVVEINPVRTARAGVKLFKKSWAEEIATLEKITTVIKDEQGFLTAGPSGVWVYLVEDEKGVDVSIEGVSNSLIGTYAGVSIETISMERSMAFWQVFGFAVSMGGLEQGWVVLTNEEGFGVSLMKPNACPHLFFNPSLTYFNGKTNPKIISKVRALDIPIAEEITHFNSEGEVDNIIIRDPGGLGFFLFSD